NRDKPGSISKEYNEQLTSQLTAKSDASTISSGSQRDEILINKYRAAMAAIEQGPQITGGDVQKFNTIVAEALADCVRGNNVQLAANALSQLTPERLAALSYASMDASRDTVLRTTARLGSRPEDIEVSRSFVSRFPDLFKQATNEQKARAKNALESML